MSQPRRMANALILPLDLIDPHPANVREQLGDLTDLAESIRRKGVLQSVVVRPSTGGRFQLITGHRRCAAARLVGRVDVPALVRPEASEADVVEDMLHENMHRRRLNPIEEAKGFRNLMTLRGWTQGQVAEAVGCGVSTVNQRIALLELSEFEQRAIVNKAMTLGDAWELAHQRRYERGVRNGQGQHGGKEARPKWVPHFNADHPLAEGARDYCRKAHAAPRSTKLSDVACGPCWEAVIRRDVTRQLRDGLVGGLPQPAEGSPMDLAGAGLAESHLGADLNQRRPVEESTDDVAVVGR